jgi:hypothetical protein
MKKLLKISFILALLTLFISGCNPNPSTGGSKSNGNKSNSNNSNDNSSKDKAPSPHKYPPSIFGVWIREEGNTVNEIEINKNEFIERTYESGVLTSEKSRDINQLDPSMNYGGPDPYADYIIKFGGFIYYTDYEIIDKNKLKIGGGDVIYSRETGSSGIEGKWSHIIDDYSLSITFTRNQYNPDNGTYLLELYTSSGYIILPYNIIIEGANLGFTDYRNNRPVDFDTKWVLIKDNKITISDAQFTNRQIEEYNKNNPSKIIKADMLCFLLSWGHSRDEFKRLWKYYALEYKKK